MAPHMDFALIISLNLRCVIELECLPGEGSAVSNSYHTEIKQSSVSSEVLG